MPRIKTSNMFEMLRNLTLFLIGASVSFDEVRLSGGITIAFVITILYVLQIFLLVPQFYKLSHYRKFYLPLIAFSLLLFAVNVFHHGTEGVSSFPRSIVLNVLLMVMVLMHAEAGDSTKVVKMALGGLAFGCVITEICFYCGVGVELDTTGQFTMFGQNVNRFAITMLIGLFIMLNYITSPLIHKWLKLAWFIPVGLCVPIVLGTGSRVAFVSMIAGMTVMVLFNPARNKLVKVLMSLAFVLAIYLVLSHLEEFAIFKRIMATVESGNTAGRDAIWAMVIPQTFEHPIFGVGQTGYSLFMTPRGFGYSPHNVFIEVFAYTGIVGLVIMCMFWFRLFKAAVLIRMKSLDMLPILVCIPIFGELMTGQLLSTKVAYIIYAVIILEYRRVLINENNGKIS